MNVEVHSDEKRKLILLIEDNPGDVRLTQEMLSEANEFKVIVAGTMAEALIVLSELPDVILLDLSLPDAKGLEAITQIHQLKAEIPIIALTGFNDIEMARKIMQAGAQDYLIKNTVNAAMLYHSICFAIERNFVQRERDQQFEAEIAELEEALNVQQHLTGWQSGSQTALAAGVGPVHLRAPELFKSFLSTYETLLDSYLKALSKAKEPPRREINDFADRIGDQGGGPKDVVHLHLNVVAKKNSEHLERRARVYAVEGRLLLLEVMGYLVDYYRVGR